ncbi:MAG: phenylalanine--tRNA ligase subunit beta [Anaerolineales bacterium]|nr:phenylalanine--tRNA ligase subunit beta [Anaerolineales bacterium]
MRVPLSWLRDFVDISLSPEEVADRLTFAGLEVEDLEYIGLAPRAGSISGLSPHVRGNGRRAKGLAWDPAKIVVAQILEVLPHPNADRLTLLRLDDGSGQEQIVLTGAPNLFQYKGAGPLPTPIKVAYAREGSVLYDGHKHGQEPMTLKRAKIRGVESYSMVCSEKELGISDEHEGIIVLDSDAPVGQPLADYMGDVVLTVKINPNVARNANMLGIARELSALTGRPLRAPDYAVQAAGPAIDGLIGIEIETPGLNPRFTAALIQGVTIGPSPYRVQRRLRLAGLRPINNVVDATNYVMLEIGQPLHAFDYDVLVARAGGQRPTLITRLPRPGETLTTLDGVKRQLDEDTILVCDRQGALSLGGVMGGAESEVSERTRSVLLEGAAWEFINIRKTVKKQSLPSEAAYRFSRGVHPAMTERGVRRGIECMRQWAGGQVAQGLADDYPLPAPRVVVALPPAEVERLLGVRLPVAEIVRILEALEFRCEAPPDAGAADQRPIMVHAPDHRLDIGAGVVGQADLIEEIARIYGYERLPETQLADQLPPQRGNPALELEERARDLLAACGAGLQEVITYALTAPQRERRVLPPAAPPDDQPYVTLTNPIVSDRVVLRHTVLAGVLDVVAHNLRHHDRLALFEIGPVYLAGESDEQLPAERRRLVIVLTGPREPPSWQAANGNDLGAGSRPMDFFDLKGVVETLVAGLPLSGVSYAAPEPLEQHPSYTPGRTARVLLNGQHAGWMGEVHPLVREQYDLPAGASVLAADLDLDLLLSRVDERYPVRPVPEYPPVKEDLAVIVDEAVPAARVRDLIAAAGGALLAAVALFDLYHGEQIGAGKKSLAYRLTYQAPDRTLTDAEVAKLRARIAKRLQGDLGAALRQQA